MTWLEGKTDDGVDVSIDVDPYTRDGHEATVLIDGEPATVTHVSRLRDGGTTTVVTDRGTITRPAPRFGEESELDGKALRGTRPPTPLVTSPRPSQEEVRAICAAVARAESSWRP